MYLSNCFRMVYILLVYIHSKVLSVFSSERFGLHLIVDLGHPCAGLLHLRGQHPLWTLPNLSDAHAARVSRGTPDLAARMRGELRLELFGSLETANLRIAVFILLSRVGREHERAKVFVKIYGCGDLCNCTSYAARMASMPKRAFVPLFHHSLCDLVRSLD